MTEWFSLILAAAMGTGAFFLIVKYLSNPDQDKWLDNGESDDNNNGGRPKPPIVPVPKGGGPGPTDEDFEKFISEMPNYHFIQPEEIEEVEVETYCQWKEKQLR